MSVEWMLFRNSITVVGAPASAGDNTATVTVPATKRLKLISGVLSASGGANTVTLKTGSTSQLVVALPATAVPTVLQYNPAGWFNGALDGDLIVNLSAATAVQVSFTYILMDS